VGKQQKGYLILPGHPWCRQDDVVVDHLFWFKKFRDDPGIGIAFLYCSFRQQQEQRLIDLFLSLLQQFSWRQSILIECVMKLYTAHGRDETRPSFREISDTLCTVIANYSRVFIIFDALDES
jgi:hypothetical protein